MSRDLHKLPPDLPVPEDDGACDHLPGLELPSLTLPSSAGPVDLAELARERLVLYVYPRTGRPGRAFAVKSTGSFATAVPAAAADWPETKVFSDTSQFGVAVWQSLPPAVGTLATGKTGWAVPPAKEVEM